VLSRIADHDWSQVAHGLLLTLSAGVAGGVAGELRDVLLRADAALYEAKRGGRNQVVIR
jgi:PleD family two-component response regulator